MDEIHSDTVLGGMVGGVAAPPAPRSVTSVVTSGSAVWNGLAVDSERLEILKFVEVILRSDLKVTVKGRAVVVTVLGSGQGVDVSVALGNSVDSVVFEPGFRPLSISWMVEKVSCEITAETFLRTTCGKSSLTSSGGRVVVAGIWAEAGS